MSHLVPVNLLAVHVTAILYVAVSQVPVDLLSPVLPLEHVMTSSK